MSQNPYFLHRGPTHIQQELVVVLPQQASWRFLALFDAVFANLREKNRVGGGQEMLRLRLHEQLQRLVAKGAVTKTAGEYHPNSAALAALVETAEESQTKREVQRTERVLQNNQRMKRMGPAD